MKNVFQLVPNKNVIASDFSAGLRDLADAVDRGEVKEAVLAFTQNGEYNFMFPSSLVDSLVLATLLQTRCVDKFKE